MPRDTSASPRRRFRTRGEEDRSGRKGKKDYPRMERADYERDSDRRRNNDDDDRRARHDDYRRRDGHRDRDRDSRRPNRERDREGQDDHDRPSRPNRERGRDGRDDGDRPSRRRSRDFAASSRRSASPKPPSSIQPSAPPRSSSQSKSPPPIDKAKPNFANSGLLAAETNAVKLTDGTSTILKYNEPPEARKPTLGWRLYVFKGSEQLELLHIHRQSAYLIGRDRTVTDILIEHPSCSKQHAVIQHRQVMEKDEFGTSKSKNKPFIIDLESTNSTHVNDEAIPTSRFYELKAGDVIKFGLSNREYVLLHDDAT
ncbi:smad nuclear interacting protein 1 [Suillus fuscotomentosus]|uniref:Smad nuclear interacting protein 1 n=1 Tax=Suillus fuscotomentosus TaxID=1912939 RepID=A0AAD4EI26_9AGAM|nr:smad nuclear interacting protein 1 [Suillus fuscotomentosus]KAG1906608.1 smad nuclear interacting protein 1 [Suillus fuscotomentosus]